MNSQRSAVRFSMAALVVLAVPACGRNAGLRYTRPPVAFDGPSTDLKQTVVVPTLDTPMPTGGNVVWCGSFAVAWQRMSRDLLKAPIRLDDAQDVAARLNAAASSESDIPPDSCYAAAGSVRDGIVDRIQADMRARYPNVPAPRFGADPDPSALIAYAYLATGAKFPIPYFESRTPLAFRGSDGRTAKVGAFGLREQDESQYHELRKQPAVLLSVPDRKSRSMSVLSEFAVDLCRSSDVQVVMAVIPRGRSLAETLRELEKEIAESGAFEGDRLGSNDTRLVPNMSWRIDHHFRELEGRGVLNVGMPIVQAEQVTTFRLDRSGAELTSEAKLMVASITMNYVFDRPFLLYLKRRGAKEPFFAAWIDNGELLSPPAPV